MPHNPDPNAYTVNDVYDMTKLNVIYAKGPFWVNANVDDEGNCGPASNPDNINDEWFYDDGSRRRRRRLSASKDESQRIYSELVESGTYNNNRAELVRVWSVRLCEWEQIQNDGEICEIPDYYDDCSDMTINPETNDIDITLEEVLSKQGVTECMKKRRREYWDFVSVANAKLSLCAGCFDPFCDKRERRKRGLRDKCANLNRRDNSALNNLYKPQYQRQYESQYESQYEPQYKPQYEAQNNIDDNYYILSISQSSAWIIGGLVIFTIILFIINVVNCCHCASKPKYAKIKFTESDSEFF